jgi:hypothetical protein
MKTTVALLSFLLASQALAQSHLMLIHSAVDHSREHGLTGLVLYAPLTFTELFADVPGSGSFHAKRIPLAELLGEIERVRIKQVSLSHTTNQWVLSAAVSIRIPESKKQEELSAFHPHERTLYVTATRTIGANNAKWMLSEERPQPEAERLCWGHLRQIAPAKEQWGLAEGKPEGAIPPVEGVDEYIRYGHPTCPSGGKYLYEPLGVAPRCTVHGVVPWKE